MAWNKRPQKGAVLPLVALCLTTLVVATALSVDIGRETAENRDLQKLADAVAIDTSRAVTGSSDAVVRTSTDKAFADSAARNSVSTISSSATYVSYVLGVWDANAQTFTPDSQETDVPN